MSENLDRVKGYLLDLDLKIVSENEAEELVVVDDEDNGIKNLVIDCEPPWTGCPYGGSSRRVNIGGCCEADVRRSAWVRRT